MDTPPVLSKTAKGKDLLVHKGFTYIFERTGSKKLIWRCTEYTASGCLGRCHTNQNNTIVLWISDHSHSLSHRKVGAKMLKVSMKNDAVEQFSKSSAQVLSDAVKNISVEVAAVLPTPRSLKRTIQKTRATGSRIPQNPTTLEDLEIPRAFQTTHSGKKFLLFDSGNSESRILVFSTEENMKFLSKCQSWNSDGTFKTAPPLFNQLFVIHGRISDDSALLPLVLCLMPNRTERCYDELFEFLSGEVGDFQPKYMMSDFEVASRNSFHSFFPNTRQKGCYFHYMQAVWKNIQAHADILRNYTNDSFFAFHMRYLAALAFMPEGDVIIKYEEILALPFFQKNSQLLRPFLIYFERTWIGPMRRGTRADPLFSLSLWNVRESVLKNVGKTNNGSEGFNTAFANILSAQHPTIWKFIDGLKKEQALTELAMARYIAGITPPPAFKKTKYENLATRLRAVTQDYNARSMEEFVQGIASNLEFH